MLDLTEALTRILETAARRQMPFGAWSRIHAAIGLAIVQAVTAKDPQSTWERRAEKILELVKTLPRGRTN